MRFVRRVCTPEEGRIEFGEVGALGADGSEARVGAQVVAVEAQHAKGAGQRRARDLSEREEKRRAGNRRIRREDWSPQRAGHPGNVGENETARRLKGPTTTSRPK
jgi:hypothetical protein